jgi:hypothetical protein
VFSAAFENPHGRANIRITFTLCGVDKMYRKKPAGSSELRIRCGEELHRQIAEAARRSLRSMTREVIFRLKASLREQNPDQHG